MAYGVLYYATQTAGADGGDIRNDTEKPHARVRVRFSGVRPADTFWERRNRRKSGWGLPLHTRLPTTAVAVDVFILDRQIGSYTRGGAHLQNLVPAN